MKFLIIIFIFLGPLKVHAANCRNISEDISDVLGNYFEREGIPVRAGSEPLSLAPRPSGAIDPAMQKMFGRRISPTAPQAPKEMDPAMAKLFGKKKTSEGAYQQRINRGEKIDLPSKPTNTHAIPIRADKDTIITEIYPHTGKPLSVEGRVHRIYSTNMGRMVDLEPPAGFKMDLSSVKQVEITEVNLDNFTLKDLRADPAAMQASVERRLQVVLDQTPGTQASKLGEGGFNVAYLSHTNPMPAYIVPGSENHLKWAKLYGENPVVIRVMQERDSFQNMAKMENGMLQFFDQMTKKATLDGQPFVRVVKDMTTDADRAIGISRRELIKGPAAADIQHAIDHLLDFDMVKGKPTKEQVLAMRLLKEAGFVTDGIVDISKARKMVRALESFYKSIDATALDLKRSRGWELTFNVSYNDDIAGTLKKANINAEAKADSLATFEDFPIEVVGGDYARGNNVNWNIKEQMWVIADPG